MWDILELCTCLISSYIYAYFACFGIHPQSNVPFSLTLIFEIIFFISFLFKFSTTFIEEGERLAETSHYLIIKHYRTNGTFYIDVLTLIPIVFFVECSRDQFYRLLYLIKVLRI